MLEDVKLGPDHATRVRRYIELGNKWGLKQTNRMIKVPATPAGLDALEELAAAGITVNVTLIFTIRQYRIARDAIWRGMQRRTDRAHAKSVYSIFISRIDVYTKKHVPQLSAAAQGQVGILNVKRIWQENRTFWQSKGLPLQQEIIFASTGTKDPSDPADKYVAALAGSDIQTNPPATNEKVAQLGKSYSRTVDKMPPEQVTREIDQKVDFQKMEKVLMEEGLAKFADPQKALLEMVAKKRKEVAPA